MSNILRTRAGKPFKPDYAKTFKREVVRAAKKAGRVIGRSVVKERVKGLVEDEKTNGHGDSDGLSSRRKKAVRYVVGRDGTLVVLDHAPMAVIQETGGIIRAKDKKLRIHDRKKVIPGAKTFVTKTGLVFQRPAYVKTGTRSSAPKVQPKPELVGVLRDQVEIPQLPDDAQLKSISERHLERFGDLLQEYIVEGFK
ncbi:MAG: hypothetical protein FJX25_09855 [Alphaproteobacteria bacterium]|nr:hypothetical protein [Alphaproteobacteria bacterium]